MTSTEERRERKRALEPKVPRQRRLERHEKETLIRFDQAGDEAWVFTYERPWQRHLQELGFKPVMDNGFGGLEFELPKKYIRKPQPPRRRREVADV